MFPVSDFPAVAAVIEDGIARQLHTGIQIYVSRNGLPLLDAGFGQATPDQPMTSETVMPWRSAGKPLTALLILQQIETGRLKLNTPLQEVLEETVGTDKSSITIFDLLTHQSGFPSTETGWPQSEWSTIIDRIVQQPVQLPAGTAAYHPQSSWFLLGEILRRLAGADHFEQVLQHDLLDPLGLNETACGISAERSAFIHHRLPVLYERDQGQLVKSSYGGGRWRQTPSPGGNLRGPIRQLGMFLEMLLRKGAASNGHAFVSETTVTQMTSRHRENQFDQTLQHVVDFGLGVICNSNRHGAATVPYGFGRWSAEASFGHGGSQCSSGFCDPLRGLVVAWSANGFCGEGQHQRRNRMLNEAIYQDLGLI
jgi:CubicO group peptidase (beta-lactamase class C family)